MSKGQKAESLLELKRKGLFNQKLVVLEDLPEKKDFFNLLMEKGFKNGEDLAVRFSSPTKHTNLPRSIVIKSIEGVYSFIKENFKDGLYPIIHTFVFPDFGGTLIKKNDKFYINIVNGAWEPLSSQSCDVIILGDEDFIWFYPEEKECLLVEGERLIKKRLKNVEEDIISLAIFIKRKVETLGFDEDILYEFIFTPDKEFVVMEFRKGVDIGDFDLQVRRLDVLEIKEGGDLDKWDKKQDLLLSVPVDREEDIVLFDIIEKIKPYKQKVYVDYGLCSHPCIILREHGIKTIPYHIHHKKIVFS
ncbi:MAG: hypothetical protein ABIE22_05380 [archaeon]